MWAAIFDLQRRVAHLETLVFDNSTSERSRSALNSLVTSPVALASRSNQTTPEGSIEVGKEAGAALVSYFIIIYPSSSSVASNRGEGKFSGVEVDPESN